MKIMECNDPPKDKIINLPELSVKLSSMDSSSVKSSIKSFPTNSTEFLHTKLRYLDLFDNACEDYSMLLYNIYDNFYPIIESVELHLERYRIIIREYNKIIKSLNAIKIQNQSFRDDDANIMIENGKNNNESKDNQDKKKEIIQKTSYIMESFPAESCSMKLLDNEHYNATVKLFNNNIITIIYYLGDDILELTENINHICQCNIDFKQLVTQHKTHVKMFRDIVSNIMIKSNKSDNESKYDQDTKKEITYETYFRPISYILNPPFISENDQMKNTETEEIKNCTTNIHNNLSEQLDKPTETINNKKLIDITEFTSQSKFKEKLTWTSVAARCKLIIFLISLLLQIYKIIIILKKFILSKPITVTNNDRKDKKPEDIQVTKNEIRQKCPSQYFTILSISFLSIFLFLLYFYFGLSYIDQNDKCNDIFAPNIVELEKEILDHDKTIRILTEYLQRDTPLLKAVALIGGTNVDNSYTVDIIKKKLHRRNNNGFSSLHPNFIVLENLRAEHSTDVINFVRMHQKIYGNRQFIILAVFKIEQINDDSTYSIDMNRTINIVKNSFTEANIISKIIPFEPLSEEILEKYIISTAENIRQTFSREQINYNKRCLIEDNLHFKKAYGC